MKQWVTVLMVVLFLVGATAGVPQTVSYPA